VPSILTEFDISMSKNPKQGLEKYTVPAISRKPGSMQHNGLLCKLVVTPTIAELKDDLHAEKLISTLCLSLHTISRYLSIVFLFQTSSFTAQFTIMLEWLGSECNALLTYGMNTYESIQSQCNDLEFLYPCSF
jgi:hypothetical protein